MGANDFILNKVPRFAKTISEYQCLLSAAPKLVN